MAKKKRANIRGWPIMKAMCASCPFGPDGDIDLRNSVMARTTLQASQICHHPALKGKRQTHLCRGARDHQLTILFRLGWIAAATDEAFEAKSKELGVI